ncbi:hypothetical protein IFM89_006587 [Coptis chinensis]|uniref:Uncharacterized protein n=1 Tax=Coptis chinensis TaxID=261450 RepID=A0A835II50_9MAGN|nr:hypothetical protein IFM89_006587 [Coptis chinensis]
MFASAVKLLGKKPKPKLKPIELKTPPEQTQTISRVIFDVVKEHGPLTIADTWEHIKPVCPFNITSFGAQLCFCYLYFSFGGTALPIALLAIGCLSLFFKHLSSVWPKVLQKPLKVDFEGIYHISSNKNGLVNDMMVRDGNNISWDLHLRRRLNDWEVVSLADLLVLLDTVSITDDDTLVRVGDANCFTVKACTNRLMNKRLTD